MFRGTIYHWNIKYVNGGLFVVEGYLTPETHMSYSIRTSWIERLNIKDGWVKTRNSFYKLDGKELPND